MKPENADIHNTGDTLTIKGETKAEKEIKREDHLNQEQRYGTFGHSLTLPVGLKSDKVEASFANGVITLTIPKAEEMKPKAIKVKAKRITEGKKE